MSSPARRADRQPARNRPRRARAQCRGHIADGGPPPAHDGPGRNFLLGSALHMGACVFWATIFEAVCGRAARRSEAAAWIGAANTATAAYAVDYHCVPARLRPGMERFLSTRSLVAVYGALAVGLAWAVRGRRRHRAQVENEPARRRRCERRPA